ncbi:MAG: succinate dehydrogenase cytochrome b subunit [Gemmatimonadota bacterium]
MQRWLGLYRSSIGKKIIVAVTGALMLAFLVGHVVGNLKVFLPDPEPGVADIDAYAEFLRSAGEPLVPHGAMLWAVRIVLVAALVLHVTCVLQLSARSRAARPEGYRARSYKQASLSARMMMVSGVLLFAFIVFHILHFTTGTVDPADFTPGAVYANLRRAFTQWSLVALYVVAMAGVGLHVFHGAWSVFQSLGLDNPDRNRLLRGLSVVLAVALFIGFATVPLSFALGALGPRASSTSVSAPAAGAAFASSPADPEVTP